MVQKYIFGNPFQTNAVVNDIPASNFRFLNLMEKACLHLNLLKMILFTVLANR